MLGIIFFEKCFGFTVDAGLLNLNFFWGVSTSSSGDIFGSTSEMAEMAVAHLHVLLLTCPPWWLMF